MRNILVVLSSATLVFFLAPQAAAQEELMQLNIPNESRPITELRQPNSQDAQRLEATQEINEATQERVANFRARISTIQDEQKKIAVEAIVGKISAANTQLTSRMSEALDKFEIILNRLKVRAENVATNGGNALTLLSAIKTAEGAIAVVRVEVDNQSNKEYSANITSDATLRTTIGSMVSEFRGDIVNVFEAVKAAQAEVKKAIEVADNLENAPIEATNSANIE